MDEKWAAEVLEALAEKISNLKVDVYLKVSECERLKKENIELKQIISELKSDLKMARG